jgi:hypothetical protein
MKRPGLILLLSILLPVIAVAAQSLADLARAEAERRKQIERQGIPAKRIESFGRLPEVSRGAVSTSNPAFRPAAAAGAAAKTEPRPALRTFQSRLQKLDGEIAKAEDRIKLLRAKADAARWAPMKITKGSQGGASASNQDQLHWQILELEGKIAALRRERSDVFQAGRRAGYLPGELEGRGILRSP